LGGSGFNRLGITDIEGDGVNRAAFLFGARECLGVEIPQAHFAAFCGDAFGGLQAKARRAAGDDCIPARKAPRINHGLNSLFRAAPVIATKSYVALQYILSRVRPKRTWEGKLTK